MPRPARKGIMFDYTLVRYGAVGVLLAAYGGVDGLSKLMGWRHRPPRVRRPLWSHLLAFTSLMAFYGLIGPNGRSVQNDLGNQIGVLLCMVAMTLRFMARRGGGPVSHPDLVARTLFFAALPVVVGSPWGWIALTVPQAIVAAKEAGQRIESAASPARP